MPIVVDASIALAWCFPDESNHYADAVLTALESDVALVPAIWPLEVANGLLTGIRRGRIGSADVAGAEQVLGGFDSVSVTMAEALGSILPLASSLALTVYDASYLHLALREGASLATLDDHLRAAARTAGFRVFEPA